METRLELLLKAYVELTMLWSKMNGGETASRVWASVGFLEKLIRKELDK
jgi:hypothetical protein